MNRAVLFAMGCMFVASLDAEHGITVRRFTVISADGTVINGQADIPAADGNIAVIMVAGTGMFNRDVHFGISGMPRDFVFADLSARMNARGLIIVCYDRRGMHYGVPAAEAVNRSVSARATVDTMRDDLAAVYDWKRSEDGPGSKCIVFFGHSDGMAHIGRLAAAGAPAPDLVIGMGALLESPLTVVRWQLAGAWSYSRLPCLKGP